MINTLQLAARKNLIQMSFRTFKALINNLPWLFCFSIPEKQRVQKQAWHNSRINNDNCNLIDVPGPDFAKVNWKHEAKRVTLCLEAEGRHFDHLL
jgi:hypothetical protein